MITLFQLSEKILREERMTLSTCPWAINFPYTGTAPADLETERRRTIYEAIIEGDRELRRQFHMKSPKTLLESATFTLDGTERPFPVTYLLLLYSSIFRIMVLNIQAESHYPVP